MKSQWMIMVSEGSGWTMDSMCENQPAAWEIASMLHRRGKWVMVAEVVRHWTGVDDNLCRAMGAQIDEVLLPKVADRPIK